MPYNNSSTNKDEEIKVYTSNTTLRNPGQEHPCAVVTLFINDSIRLQFAPELPPNQQSQSRRYDYDHSIFTGLTRFTVQSLAKAYRDQFEEKLAAGEEFAISIPIAKVHQLQIATNIATDGEPHPVLRFIQNIDENNLTAQPENILTYEFNRGETLENYNPETGNFDKRVITHSELELFIHDLEAFRDSSSHSYVHAHRVVERSYKDGVTMKLNRIGEANGLHFDEMRSGGNRNPNQPSMYANKGNNSQPYADIQHINSMDELDQAMGGDSSIPENVDELPFGN